MSRTLVTISLQTLLARNSVSSAALFNKKFIKKRNRVIIHQETDAIKLYIVSHSFVGTSQCHKTDHLFITVLIGIRILVRIRSC